MFSKHVTESWKHYILVKVIVIVIIVVLLMVIIYNNIVQLESDMVVRVVPIINPIKMNTIVIHLKN